MVDDPLPPLVRLEQRFQDSVVQCGGKLVHFSLSPSKREVQVLIELDRDLFLDDEGREMKEAFEEIERNFYLDEKKDKVEEAVQDLSELAEQLQDPDEGIL